MTNLRTRLLIGYGYLVVLLLLTAGSAGFGFFTISEAIDRILSEKFESVSASIQMMESLERQNVLTIEALIDEQVDTDELEAAQNDFEEAVVRAREFATVDGERQLIDELEQRFFIYVETRDQVLLPGPRQDDLLIELLGLQIFPPFIDVRHSVYELLEINSQAIADADAEAQATAMHMAGILGLLVTVAMVSMVFLARALREKVLRRLRNITEVAEAIRGGDYKRRFDTSINDELGLVSRQLNAALDTRDEYQHRMHGRLNQHRQLVLGLLTEVRGELLLLGLDGALIASSCQQLEADSLAPVQEWLVGHRKEMLQEFTDTGEQVEFDTTLQDHNLHVRLLTANQKRPVGWMVRVDGDEDEGDNGDDQTQKLEAND